MCTNATVNGTVHCCALNVPMNGTGKTNNGCVAATPGNWTCALDRFELRTGTCGM